MKLQSSLLWEPKVVIFGCRGVSRNIRGDVSSSKSQHVDGPRGVLRGDELFSKEEDIKEATLLACVVPAQQWTWSGVMKRRQSGLIVYLD